MRPALYPDGRLCKGIRHTPNKTGGCFHAQRGEWATSPGDRFGGGVLLVELTPPDSKSSTLQASVAPPTREGDDGRRGRTPTDLMMDVQTQCLSTAAATI